MSKTKHESPHILAYIMEIDRAIRNGEYPNAAKMNKKMGWTISRSTFFALHGYSARHLQCAGGVRL